MKAPRLLLREHVKDTDHGAHPRAARTRPASASSRLGIAQEFGTSQAPVREALRDLESLRFVESEAFRGARVRAVSRRELRRGLPRARLRSRQVAARQAAIELDGNVGELERHLAAMVKAAAEGRRHEQVRSRRRLPRDDRRRVRELDPRRGLERRSASRRARSITTLRTAIDLEEIAAIHEPIARRDPSRAIPTRPRRRCVGTSTSSAVYWRKGTHDAPGRPLDARSPGHAHVPPRAAAGHAACTRAGRSSPSGSAPPSTARPG